MRIVEQSSSQSARGPVEMRRLSLRLLGDERRVILLPFVHGGKLQIQAVFDFLEQLSDAQAAGELENIKARFAGRHMNFQDHLLENYERSRSLAGRSLQDDTRRLLAGAFFTMEYSFEATALFNPSIVPHPDQSGVNAGSLRFVMSLRAIGEGHLSSAVFHTGILDQEGGMTFDPLAPFAVPTRTSADRVYIKDLFCRKLVEMGLDGNDAEKSLSSLPASFTARQLVDTVAQIRGSGASSASLKLCLESMLWLAKSNYMLRLRTGASINQLLLFPRSDNESRGIEDLRLVRFTEESGTAVYYGTYTAFSGSGILPMFLDTPDFRTISVHTLNGACAQNKGMAFFPRRINGHYAMCSRIDGRNLFLMYSDHIHFWESARMLASPKYAWEYRLMGNCGSPLETAEGWLLITHGVGPMRQYAIGAMLLDHKDPFQIRGRLREPLVVSTDDEREGYVPNAVYSCGALIWNGKLVLPYAIADRETTVAEIDLNALLQRILADGP
jgi:predicted GH43/DUF377 family glycosyl hydrolase